MSKTFIEEYNVAAARKPINFNELWNVAERGIAKLKSLTAGDPSQPFTAEDLMALYSAIYTIVNRSGRDQHQRLYEYYRHAFEDHLSSTALPSLLQHNQAELLLRDFAARWLNHKRMASSMTRIFYHLEQYYIPELKLPRLNEVAFVCFRDLVYAKTKDRIRDAALFLMDRVRDGEQVDGALLKNVVDTFVEIGSYGDDFEAPMLDRAAAYYMQKATKWVLQADECLNVEKYRVCPYLHTSSEAKLLARVGQELLVLFTSQLQLRDKEEMQV